MHLTSVELAYCIQCSQAVELRFCWQRLCGNLPDQPLLAARQGFGPSRFHRTMETEAVAALATASTIAVLICLGRVNNGTEPLTKLLGTKGHLLFFDIHCASCGMAMTSTAVRAQ